MARNQKKSRRRQKESTKINFSNSKNERIQKRWFNRTKKDRKEEVEEEEEESETKKKTTTMTKKKTMKRQRSGQGSQNCAFLFCSSFCPFPFSFPCLIFIVFLLFPLLFQFLVFFCLRYTPASRQMRFQTSEMQYSHHRA